MGSIASPIVAAQYYEWPYIYAKTYQQTYTTSAPLTGRTGQFDDVIKSDGDSDFFARRALNVYNFNDQNNQTFITTIGNQNIVNPPGLDYPLAPEKLYTLGADIPFRLTITNGVLTPSVAFLSFPLGGGNTAHANIACPMFQGVKRRNGTPDNKPNYKYYEKPFSYVMQFTQDWYYFANAATLAVNSPRTFTKTTDTYDFELQAIEFSADFNNIDQTQYNGFLIKLYDANGIALMKDFVHYRYVSYNGGFNGVGANPGNTLPWYPNCFPVPPVLYPKGSNIQMDIISLLDTSAGGGGSSITQYVNFRGVRRIPC